MFDSERYQLVPFDKSESHYETVIAAWNEAFPDYKETVEDLKRQDRNRQEKYDFERFIIVHKPDQALVGYITMGHTFWSYHPDRYYYELHLLKDHASSPLKSALYETIEAHLVAKGAMSIEAEARETHIEDRELLAEWGYQVKTVEFSSILDLADFDPSQYRDRIDRLAENGLVVKHVGELYAEDPNFLQKFYDLIQILMKDVPWHEENTPQPFEVFVKQYEEYPNRIEEAELIALDGDEYVAMTGVRKSQIDKSKVYTGLTGVKRGYRRKGVALALKALSLGWVKENMRNPEGGHLLVITENEENNPMYQINVALGFEKQPSFFFYRKALKHEKELEKN